MAALTRYLDHEPPEEINSFYEQQRTMPVFGDSRFVSWVKQTFFKESVEPEKPETRFLAPTIEQIKKSVAAFYGVPEATFVKQRRGHTNEPRDLAIYLCRRMGGETLSDIGLHFGMPNYSSVSSAIQRVIARMHRKSVRKQSAQIITDLKMLSKKESGRSGPLSPFPP